MAETRVYHSSHMSATQQLSLTISSLSSQNSRSVSTASMVPIAPSASAASCRTMGCSAFRCTAADSAVAEEGASSWPSTKAICARGWLQAWWLHAWWLHTCGGAYGGYTRGGYTLWHGAVVVTRKAVTGVQRWLHAWWLHMCNGAVVVAHTCMVVTHVHVRYLVFEQGGLVGRPIEARAQRRNCRDVGRHFCWHIWRELRPETVGDWEEIIGAVLLLFGSGVA